MLHFEDFFNDGLGKASKKKVKLGLLAEVRAGRRLRGGRGPNPVISYLFIALKWFKGFKTWKKAIKNMNVIIPPLSTKTIIFLFQKPLQNLKINPCLPRYSW